MGLTAHTQKMLDRIQELLPVSDNEIVQRGITETATARIVELRQRAAQLVELYGSLEMLEERVRKEGVPPDDHTMYTDMLEWRAVRNELATLTGFLETV